MNKIEMFLPQAEPRFLWNNYMLEVLIDNKVCLLARHIHFVLSFFSEYIFPPPDYVILAV